MMTAYTGTVPEYADRETKPTADELELEAYYQTLEGYEPDSKDFVLSEAYEPDLEIQPMIRESLGDDG